MKLQPPESPAKSVAALHFSHWNTVKTTDINWDYRSVGSLLFCDSSQERMTLLFFLDASLSVMYVLSLGLKPSYYEGEIQSIILGHIG